MPPLIAHLPVIYPPIGANETLSLYRTYKGSPSSAMLAEHHPLISYQQAPLSALF